MDMPLVPGPWHSFLNGPSSIKLPALTCIQQSDRAAIKLLSSIPAAGPCLVQRQSRTAPHASSSSISLVLAGARRHAARRPLLRFLSKKITRKGSTAGKTTAVHDRVGTGSCFPNVCESATDAG